MYRKARPLFFICNTPTHVGSGSELGVVDLPIQRERHTGFPKFEASSVKGSIRDEFERKIGNDHENLINIQKIFGYDEDGLPQEVKTKFKGETVDYNSQFSGALGFTDARILLFPVKSMKGIFAWATCLRVLRQFASDMALVSSDFEFVEIHGEFLENDQVYLFNPEASIKVGSDKVILEEYTFTVSNELNGVVKIRHKGKESNFPDWLSMVLFGEEGNYWSQKMKKDIIVLPDDDFKDFVNLSTEVVTRTKIDNEKGTVAKGALFNEEYLPAETVMYTLLLTTDEFRKEKRMKEEEVFKFFESNLPNVIQIGGNATLGKGILTTKIVEL